MSVTGVCESCKARIEKAAKQAGATSANWNIKTHILEITYDDSVTSLSTLEKKIALAGHDTRDVKSSLEAYNKLPTAVNTTETELSMQVRFAKMIKSNNRL